MVYALLLVFVGASEASTGYSATGRRRTVRAHDELTDRLHLQPYATASIPLGWDGRWLQRCV